MGSILVTLLNRLAERPKTLFLIDGVGAFATAFLLIAILRPYSEYFGMPQAALVYLSAIAICYCAYSTTCFLLLARRWTPYLRVIGTANLLYCAVTLALLLSNFSTLTIIGTVYFLLEMLIIGALSFAEFKVADKTKCSSKLEQRTTVSNLEKEQVQLGTSRPSDS